MNTKTTSPKTLQEAILHFSDPDTCLAYMKPLVWANGVTCPHCGVVADHHFITTRRIWRCSDCKKQFTIKLGTVMAESPLGLDKWLAAMWLISNAKNGISSYEIHRALGITQKSAWFLLHRIRLAMHTGTFKKTSGIVEADETFVGGKLKFKHKNKRPAHKIAGTMGKAIVTGVLQRGQDGSPSQMQATTIENTHGVNAQSLIREIVPAGSTVMTDTGKGFSSLQNAYVHLQVNHDIEFVRNLIIHTNGTENFWSLLKRTIKGTYIAVDPVHLERYVGEQCFRFNHRKLNDGGRMELTVSGVSGKRLTYKQLIGKDDAVGEIPGLPS